jgi:hypothetical protein
MDRHLPLPARQTNGVRLCVGLVLALSTFVACGSASSSEASAFSGAGSASSGAGSAFSGAASHAIAAPCGTAGAEALARTVGLVGLRIYHGELSSGEVSNDRSQVENYAPLLNAVAEDNRAATEAAVTSLVYSGTHIVRLRVSARGALLSDVGGPSILAPVRGTLRLHGHVVGDYTLSVQDDLGYVKLVSRFLGVPLVLREGSRSVAIPGTLLPGPAAIPEHGPVRYRHVSYQAFSFDATSFPRGVLRVSLLAPITRSLSLTACTEIKVAELGNVAQRLARLFVLSPLTFSSFIKATQPLTGGLIFIRSGSRQLAAGAPHPAQRLPDSGTVTYRGKSYEVFSFTAGTQLGQVRIYQLVPAELANTFAQAAIAATAPPLVSPRCGARRYCRAFRT